jgi:hypothetical protein
MTMYCDHVVGVWAADDNNFLRASELSEALAIARRIFDEWAENPRALPSIVAEGRAMTDQQLLERRASMFSFCPDCGARLK